MTTDDMRGANAADDAEKDHCDLRLLPGPRLLWRHWHYDDAAGRGEYLVDEVTDRAASYALEPVTLAEGVRLVDLFALVAGSPALIELLRRDFAQELLEEVGEQLRSGVMEPLAQGSGPCVDIEYLEVYQAWHAESRRGRLHSTARAHLHGVGPVLEEDVYEHGHLMYAKGTRIQWGVSFCRPRDLAHLQVRVNPEVTIYEDDPDAANHGQPVQAFRRHDLTLLQVLHAVFWELSFHGAGSERDAALQEIVERAEEVARGEAEVVSLDDVRARLRSLHDGTLPKDGHEDSAT